MSQFHDFQCISRRTVLLYMCLVALCVFNLGKVYAASENSTPETKLESQKMVIGDIKLIGVSDRMQFLKRGFSEIVQVALLPYADVDVIPRGILWSALRKLNVPYEDRTPDRIFESDVLDSPGVDARYVLSGKLVGFGDKLQFNLELLDRKSGEVTDLGPYMLTVSSIFHTAEDVLAFDINEVIAANNFDASNNKQIVFVCIENPNNSVSRRMPFLIPDLKSNLVSRLKNDYQLMPNMSFEITHNCAEKAMASKDWKNQSQIVVLIDAQLDWVKRSAQTPYNLIIKSTMRVNRNNINISLVDLKNNNALNKSDRTLKSDFLTVVSKYVGKSLSESGLAQLEYLSYVDLASRADPNIAADLIQGIERYNNGDDVFSLPYFQRVKNIDHNNSTANYYIGRVLADNREYDDSIKYYDTAISSNSNNPQAHQSLGDVYYEKGDYISAMEQYKIAIATGGSKMEAMRGLAYVHLMNDDLDSAKNYFLQILENNPNDLDTVNSMGVIAIKQGEYDVAAKWLKKALELDRDNARAKSNLSLAYQHLAKTADNNDDIDGAINYLSNDIEINATNKSVDYTNAQLRRSQLYIKKAAFENETAAKNAIPDLKELVRQYENNPKLNQLKYAEIDLAMAVLMSGDYNSAVRLTEEVLRNQELEAEQRIFVRMLNISANMLLDRKTEYELGILSKELTSVRRPRKISRALDDRYFTFYNFTANTKKLNNEKKEELENISYLAKGNAKTVKRANK